MNWPTWSAIWSSIAPAVGDHLWQSTLFAMVAGGLAWYLRKNQARARYGLVAGGFSKIPDSLFVACELGQPICLAARDKRTER